MDSGTGHSSNGSSAQFWGCCLLWVYYLPKLRLSTRPKMPNCVRRELLNVGTYTELASKGRSLGRELNWGVARTTKSEKICSVKREA